MKQDDERLFDAIRCVLYAWAFAAVCAGGWLLTQSFIALAKGGYLP